MHDAFLPISRSRGVHQAEQIVGLAHVYRGRVGACGQNRGVALRGFIHQDYGRKRLDDRCELPVGEQQLGTRTFRELPHLVGGETEINRQENRADVAYGEGNLEEGSAIPHKDGNDILRADAPCREKTSRRLDAPQEFCVGYALSFEYDGGPVRRARSVITYETRQVHHDVTHQYDRGRPRFCIAMKFKIICSEIGAKRKRRASRHRRSRCVSLAKPMPPMVCMACSIPLDAACEAISLAMLASVPYGRPRSNRVAAL